MGRIMLGARALLLVNFCLDALVRRLLSAWRKLAPEKLSLGWRELAL